MPLKILTAGTGKFFTDISGLKDSSKIIDVKIAFARSYPKYYPDRISFRTELRGKSLPDEAKLSELEISDANGVLYFKDLGPQIGWTTVFLCEYAGPLFVYLWFYMRPAVIYGYGARTDQMEQVVHIACACWSLHYIKRLLETVFIHRFSHNTMPILNLFKNCVYYWGFAAFIAYYINHPLYTPPYFESKQVCFGCSLFIFAELGNFSIHIALRNLRPPRTKERRIPGATANPFTLLFKLVSCPNYTYEGLAWLGFSIMTQCLPALLFCIAGFLQMAQWAIGKHQRYRREFSKDYPHFRKAIVPFLL